jgi:hypothetical protein
MKYFMSYAYDIPFYADFVVEAESEEAAEAIAEQALKDGKFSNVSGTPFYDNLDNERVFSSGVATEDQAVREDSLEELLAEADK